MQTKIAVLYGLAGSGKTSTIGLLADWILDRAPKKVFENTRLRTETVNILELDGIRIGIISRGDVLADVLRGLEWLHENNCDIVVICCRMSQRVRTSVNLKIKQLWNSADQQIAWIEKRGHHDRADANTINAQNRQTAITILASVGLEQLVPEM